MAFKKKVGVVTLFVLVATTFSSCFSLTGDVKTDIDQPRAFSSSGTFQTPDEWWRAFQDAQLNLFVAQSLEGNYSLKSVYSRLKASNAVVDRESAEIIPHLEGFASAQKARSETTDTEEIELGVMSDYEVDLWGRIRANIESDRFESKATYADYQAAALSLSVETTRTWYQLTEALNQLNLIEDQIKANEKILKLLQARFRAGQGRTSDLLRQEQLLESTREEYYRAESRLQVLENRLVVLTGLPPQEKINFEPRELPDLPPFPETGLPVQLIRRRPDTQAAFYRLQASDRNVAAAISDRFPRLSLSFSISTEDDRSIDLFDNWARSIAGSLAAPLLDAGRRRAEVERTRAVKEQRLYEYGQTVLSAFQDVEDAIVIEKKLSLQVASISKQVQLAKETSERLQYEYFNGSGTYIDVITSLIALQELQRDLLSAKLEIIEARISLYRALAGGFKIQREDDHGN